MPKPWKMEMRNGAEAFEKTVALESSPEDALLLAAELKKRMKVIDLHGMFTREAIHQLEDFLHQQKQEGEESIRIVFGIGEGKLRDAVSSWLHEQKMLGQVQNYKFSDREASVVVVIDAATHV